MAVRTISRDSGQSHVRGRLYTSTRAKRATTRQLSGRLFTGLLASGFVGAALFLAPTYLLPLLFMSFFVLVGGWVSDEIGPSRYLALRLLGPTLALAGLILVTWLLVTGSF